MLTTEDRRWLSGEKRYEGEHAKQQRYQRRRDIRERVYNSILDFSILFQHLEDDERAKLFGTSGTNTKLINEDQQFTNGICDALAFFLYNTGITSLMATDTNSAEPLGEWLLAEALHRAGQKDGILVETVDLTIDATTLPRESILEDLKAGNELSPGELRVLLDSDHVDTQTVQEHLRRQLFDDA